MKLPSEILRAEPQTERDIRGKRREKYAFLAPMDLIYMEIILYKIILLTPLF